MSPSPKILIVRTDRLGDVLMCLPAVEYLRSSLPEASLHFHFLEGYQETLKPYLDARDIHCVKTTKNWRKFLKDEKFTAVLMLFGAGEIARAAFVARTPTRVGMLSKPSSFIWFNAGVRQKRSRSEKSEAEYNLDLAKALDQHISGAINTKKNPPICMPVDEKAKAEAMQALNEIRVDAGKPFLVMHPGMGGSALNLSLEQYLSIAQDLIQRNHRVVLSEGPYPRDKEMVAKMLSANPALVAIRGQKLSVLKEIFRLAKTVIAPSTGPIHLAHYVGTPTVGVYSPVRSHHPKRWAPWGGSAATQVVYPQVECPGTKDCVGSRCPRFYCMESLPWSSLILQATNGLKA